MHALTTGNLDEYLDVFAENIAFMTPDGPQLDGRDAIAEYVRPFFADFITQETDTPIEVIHLGDLAFEYGDLAVAMRPKTGDSVMRVMGKYLFVAQRQLDGAWRYTQMIWNSNQDVPVDPLPQGASVQSPSAVSSTAQAADVRGALRRIETAINLGDMSTVATVLAEDAVLMPPGTDLVTGADAARALVESASTSRTFAIEIRPIRTRVSGPWAITRGSLGGHTIVKSSRAREAIDDKFLAVFRLGPDQEWRVARLLWNHNR